MSNLALNRFGPTYFLPCKTIIHFDFSSLQSVKQQKRHTTAPFVKHYIVVKMWSKCCS